MDSSLDMPEIKLPLHKKVEYERRVYWMFYFGFQTERRMKRNLYLVFGVNPFNAGC